MVWCSELKRGGVGGIWEGKVNGGMKKKERERER